MVTAWRDINSSSLVAPQLSFALLGQPLITHEQQGVVTLGNRKALALLAYLAIEEGQAHSRENVLGLLWPDLPNTDARNNLRFTWSHLAAKLNTAGKTENVAHEPLLISTRLSLQFNAGSMAWLDVCEFQKLLAACDAHAAHHEKRNTCVACAQRLARAAELYRGTFLDGLSLNDCPAFDEWQFVQRERLHLQMMAALDDLTQFYERNGQPSLAEPYARRQIELDPLHENAHRQRMRLLDKQGHRTAALAQFEHCKTILQNELGVQPDAETTWLYQRIKAGEPFAAAPNTSSALQASPSSFITLPTAATPFVGREDEMQQMSERMAAGEYRLFTLVGAGGMGKTRLAVQLAHQNAHRYAQGVCFVSLAAVQHPRDIADALAAALGQAFGLSFVNAQHTLWQQVLSALRERKCLLVLDNFEQLLHTSGASRHLMARDAPLLNLSNGDPQSAVDFVLALLHHAPDVHLIVTTREPLHVQAEDLFWLGGLAVPSTELASDALGIGALGAIPIAAIRSLPADVSNFSAVRLFCDRAHRVNKSFKLSAENVVAVVRICRLVEGSPLGIELAASWLANLGMDEFVTAIMNHVDSLDLFETQLSDVPAHHRSMRAVFEQSWRMLAADERKLLAQLGVFRGGFSLDAAKAIAGASPITLTRLRYKSLVQTSGNGRYDLHELLRQFALAQLTCDEDLVQATRQKHSDFYVGFVTARAAALVGKHPRTAQTEIREELDNVRDAWRWATTQPKLHITQACIESLALFYNLSGLHAECERVFGEALSRLALHNANPALRLALLLAPIEALGRQAKLNLAMQHAEQALQLADALNDIRQQGYCQRSVGFVHFLNDSLAKCQHHMQTALMLARRNHDLSLEADATRYLGVVLTDMGERVQGEAHLLQALRLQRMLGNSAQEQALLINIGVCRIEQNDMVMGATYLQEALALVPLTGSRVSETRAENALGFSLAALGNFETALGHHERSRQIAHECGEHVQQSHALHNLCTVNRKLGRLAQAEECGCESLRLAVTYSLAEAEAYAWLHVGYVWIAMRHWDAAHDAFTRLCNNFEGQARIALVAEARCGLAAAALGRGQLADAMAQVELALQYKSAHGFNGTDEPFEMYLTCYRVLETANDARAPALLAEAKQILQARTQHIGDPQMLARMMTQVPVYRELTCNTKHKVRSPLFSSDLTPDCIGSLV